MKKILFAAMAVFAVFALIGCAEESDSKPTPPPPTTQKVTVSFDANLPEDQVGPTAPASKEINQGATYGGALPTMANTDPDGWIFDGWFLPNGTEATASTTFSADTKLTAEWQEPLSENDWRITFHLNGGDALVGIDGGHSYIDIPKGSAFTAITGISATRTGYVFAGWYDEEGDVKYDASFEPSGNTDMYAAWDEEISEEPLTAGTGLVDDVSIGNAWFAVYKFDLKSGQKWEDFVNVTAEYKMQTTTLAVNSARATRLMGNYKDTDFRFETGNAGTAFADRRFAIADLNTKNAPYIFDDLGQGWANLTTAITAFTGEAPVGDTWFKLTYLLDGSRKNAGYQAANTPANADEGPFYYAVGIPSQDGFNRQMIRNVTLVNLSGNAADDVLGVPLVFKLTNDGNLYPAFVGYPTTDGSNGFGVAKRDWTVGTVKEVTPVEITKDTYTVSLKYNYPDAYNGDKQTDHDVTTNFNGYITAADLLVDAIPGFVFKGWYRNAEGTGSAITATNTAYTANTEIFAKWIPGKKPAEAYVVNFPLVKSNATGGSEPGYMDNDDFVGIPGTSASTFKFSGSNRLLTYAFPDIFEDDGLAVDYEQIRVTLVITDWDPERTGGDVVKLTMKRALEQALDVWSAASEGYTDISLAALEGQTAATPAPITYTVNLDAQAGWAAATSAFKIQNNGNMTFTLGIAKIEFISSSYAE